MLAKHPILIGVVSVLLTLSVWFLLAWTYFLRTPLVFDDQGLKYTVPSGASITFVVNDLYLQNIIKRRWMFNLLVRLQGGVRQLKAGEYLFPKGSTPVTILNQMRYGSGMVYHTFMILPGWDFKQLRQALLKDENLHHSSNELSDDELMKRLGAANLKPEGQFFPETYYFIKGSSDFLLLKKSFQMMLTKLNAAWKTRDLSIPFQTPYEVLIAASLVEKEAYIESDRAMIAGVLINRLNRGIMLQFDPTVIYSIGSRYDGKIYKEDLRDNSPYNTYVHKGLPPTPIAMPGYESIMAVLHPKHHNYIYFVAKGDGGHQFSATLAEHNKAVSASKHFHRSYFNSELIRYYFLTKALKKMG